MEPRHLARLGQPDTERLVNEISDEAQQEISAMVQAIHLLNKVLEKYAKVANFKRQSATNSES